MGMRHCTGIIYALLLAFSINAYSQEPELLELYTDGKDTMPMVSLKAVEINEQMGEQGKATRARFTEMIHDVREALPYARFFARKMRRLDSTLSTIDDRKERNAFLKKEEKKLKGELKSELKDLDYDQGRILIKLISRETDRTTYELIKRYKSGLKATMWQTAAKVFSMDLKRTYDKQEEEALERILEAIDRRDVKLQEVELD
jgi:hypothetical protein